MTPNHLGSIWYHTEALEVFYSQNQFLGLDFFCRFLQQIGSSTPMPNIYFLIFRSLPLLFIVLLGIDSFGSWLVGQRLEIGPQNYLSKCYFDCHSYMSATFWPSFIPLFPKEYVIHEKYFNNNWIKPFLCTCKLNKCFKKAFLAILPIIYCNSCLANRLVNESLKKV